MRLYEIETRNFSFKVFTDSEESFEVLMRKAWEEHCSNMGIEFDDDFFRMMLTDAECFIVRKDTVYRDHSVLYSK